MLVKSIVDADSAHYRVPSMLINTVSCGWKCFQTLVDDENGEQVVSDNDHNCCCSSDMASLPNINVDIDDVIDRYMKNRDTKAIVFGGLEPFEQDDDIIEFVKILRTRYKCDDDVVIYTGYYPIEKETRGAMLELEGYKNIIIKWGRYIPHGEPVFDEVLGVTLPSDNQFGERIS